MKLIRLFITYLKRNENTGDIYAGHASGWAKNESPIEAEKIMKRRESSHHKSKDGFSAGNIDKFSKNKEAIIGREQLLIEKFRKEERSGNDRNAISPRKKDKMRRYIKAALKLFGAVSVVAIFLYLCSIV